MKLRNFWHTFFCPTRPHVAPGGAKVWHFSKTLIFFFIFLGSSQNYTTFLWFVEKVSSIALLDNEKTFSEPFSNLKKSNHKPSYRENRERDLGAQFFHWIEI